MWRRCSSDFHGDIGKFASQFAFVTAGAAPMTVDKSKALKKGTRVYWRGDAADSGMITKTSWDAVTIA